MNKYLSALFGLLFLSTGCSEEGNDDQTQDQKPQITIISPADTIALSDSVSVQILYSDDNELSVTEVSIGTQSGGNTVYHASQRGLSGQQDELVFRAYVPPILNIRGDNYILVKCTDAAGNETIKEQDFYVKDSDNIPPSFGTVYDNGFLSTSSGVVFEIAYEVQDNKALDRVEVRLLAWDGQNTGAELDMQSQTLSGTNYNGLASFDGKSSYTSGQEYKVELQVYDEAGNRSTLLMSNVFYIV